MLQKSANVPIAGVILAGGGGTRMGGRDKAFLTVDGEAIVCRTVRLLRQLCVEVVISSNNPTRYAGFSAEVAPDEFRSQGPLAGIHAAFARVHAPYALVVACDMPFLRAEPIDYLRQFIGAVDAVVPCWDGDIEPLHAFYATRLRETVQEVLRRGSGAVRDLLREINVKYVSEEEMRRVPGVEETFCNINTPEEAAHYAVQFG
jgi:molybdopterin-guanine dinucleotide biosynthesis protein A